MKLIKHINDLLYRYDCVIIPNFGGFVTNVIGAQIDEQTHAFYPPSKQISFNSYLKHNDGLLSNYIASIENISFEQANILISKEISEWNISLNSAPLNFEGIGSIYLNDRKQRCFEPQKHTNFLTSSFGLSTYTYDPVLEDEIQLSSDNDGKVYVLPVNKNVQEDITEHSIQQNEIVGSNKSIPIFIKYAASVAILMSLGVFTWKSYVLNKQDEMYLAQQKYIESKIQKATFLIGNSLPEVTLKLTKITEPIEFDKAITFNSGLGTASNAMKSFHVIAGSFRSLDNAKRKVLQLKNKGFKSSIISKNKWNLIQVAYESFSTRKEAYVALSKIKKYTDNEAWLLNFKK